MLPNGYTLYNTLFNCLFCQELQKKQKNLQEVETWKKFQNEVIHFRQTKTANLFVHEPTVSHFLRLR